MLSCPVNKINGKLQKSNSFATHGPDASGMKVLVTLPGKEPCPAETLAEGKGNMERVVEEGGRRR